MAISRICSVEGCGKTARPYSALCSMHAERLRLHGAVGPAARIDQRGTCTLEGCSRAHYGHGYCLKHYKRWKKYGDPLGGSTSWGEVKRWIDEIAVRFAGADCLTFPYSRDDYGYGKLRDGAAGNIGAHVYVLRATKGPKPTPRHEACHWCGNGHLGCVNPNHLYWGTRADNVADAKRHGTHWRGGSRPRKDI